MLEFKDEWDFKANDLYNKEYKVQYMCYIDHLSDTVGALLSNQMQAYIDIDLRDGKYNSDKTQVTVTTMHQSMHREDQFGYGLDTKKTSV